MNSYKTINKWRRCDEKKNHLTPGGDLSWRASVRRWAWEISGCFLPEYRYMEAEHF